MANAAADAVAVIGMAGRFPRSADVEALWANLRDGIECIAFFDDRELAAAGVDEATLARPEYVKAHGAISGIELFDAAFFDLTPREAELLDPQKRFLLESAWEALENAGYDPARPPGPVGVFAGVSGSGYLFNNVLANPAVAQAAGLDQIALGVEKDFLTTLVSYKLNLQGPSLDVQTACSTSLVSVHLACQSLLGYQCDMALAGGVSIQVPQQRGHHYQKGGILSPDGHCRAFDAAAAGTVGGSGVGMVVLRRLEDALDDGDRVWAVILGSAMNNDGSTKVGYTAPSVEGQSKVISNALAVAGVEPDDISYIETHGTGTPLGDPIEVAALSRVFRRHTARRGFCALGSVKTNLGHLDAAAGVAGLIKTVLSLAHRQIPPSLHFTAPNPQIDFAASPFYVNTALADWQSAGPRRAGLSSFGIGGTNVHVVLEEPPSPPALAAASTLAAPPAEVLLLSARTEAALERASDRLSVHLRSHPEQPLADVAHTLAAGRHRFAWRRAILCRERETAAEALETRSPRRVWTGLAGIEGAAAGTPALRSLGERPVTYLLPGLGDHYAGMARGLYDAVPAFREELDACLELARGRLGLDLRGHLLDREATAAAPSSDGGALKRMLGRGEPAGPDLLASTLLAQPALFAVEHALAGTLTRLGMPPESMLGYSLGEYVAACLAGVFSLEDALLVVAERARMIEELPPGSLLAVPMGEQEATRWLTGGLDLSAINGPDAAVVAGPPTEIARLVERLASEGIVARPLRVAHAFHSRWMEPLRGRVASLLASVELHPPRVPFLSNVTGTWIRPEEAVDPEYWSSHLCRKVRFADGVAALLREPARVFIEVGPGASLSSLLLQHPAAGRGRVAVSTLRHAWDPQPDDEVLLAGLAKLWLSGIEVDWAARRGDAPRRRVPLPTYPFERQRFWIDPAPGGAAGLARAPRAGKNPDLAEWFYTPAWRESLRESPREAVPPPAVSEAASPAAPGEGPWLVLLDRRGLGRELASILARRGEVATVEASGAFARLGEGSYAIDPRRAEDYLALCAELAARRRLPRRIVHLWSVTEETEGDVEARQDLGILSLLFLAQALAACGLPEELEIAAVANGLHDVSGEEWLSPEKATLLGPCLVLPQELPGVSCRSLDVVLPTGASWETMARLAVELAAELASPAADPVVACRGRRRWVREMQPVRLEAGARPAVELRPGGAYLLTGGTGGIGLAIAGLMAREAGARLALLGRSGLPPRAEWDRRLAGGESDLVGRRIRQVRAIEEAGGEVMVLAAEVSDRAALQEALRQVRERFGPLHGVVHAAGTAAGGLAALATAEGVRATLAPKVAGTLLLAELLRDEPLDFFLLCSSLSSLLGGLGQADYCAANAFLDAFARQRAAAGGPPVVSVAWDVWKDVGMAAEVEVPAEIRRQRERHLRYAITPAEGVECFRRILGRPLPGIAVSTQHLPSLVEWSRRRLTEADELEAAPAAAAGARPGLKQAYAAPRNEIEEDLAAVWQEVLGIDRIGIHDPFSELGGHSLLAMRITARVQKRFGVHLPLRSLFEAPTIAELAVAIVEETARQAGGEEAALVASLAGLSDDEAEALLAGAEPLPIPGGER